MQAVPAELTPTQLIGRRVKAPAAAIKELFKENQRQEATEDEPLGTADGFQAPPDAHTPAISRALRVEDNAVVVVAAPTPSDSLVGKTFLHAIVTAQEKPKLVKRLMRDPAPVEAAL
ncbi:hypothetical protein CYMTET_28032 [Cymbomonas tetramitiformis]|uniref:Uncharacterized protein n=1 Tax=Cymbomonas tetramitiformis TaxID=36881 RepID=A0AAE0FNP8_9CHLO|nr:hypothetical protein CYMTET_28032 [Cymbomonas tetramitiformis]